MFDKKVLLWFVLFQHQLQLVNVYLVALKNRHQTEHPAGSFLWCKQCRIGVRKLLLETGENAVVDTYACVNSQCAGRTFDVKLKSGRARYDPTAT